MKRRGLLGSIMAAPLEAIHGLRKSSGFGWVSAGSISCGKSVFPGLDDKFSALDVYETGALADEYAAIPINRVQLQYPASLFGPPPDFGSQTLVSTGAPGTIVTAYPGDVWTWQPFPAPAGDSGFPDVGEL